MSRRNPTKEKYLSPEEWNQLMDGFSYLDLEVTESRTTVHTKIGEVSYYTSLTGDKKDIPAAGNIWSCFTAKVPQTEYELKNKEKYGYKVSYDALGHKHVSWDFRDPGGFNYVNEDYSLQPLKCYSYDINSAYSYAMLKPMPNTDVEPVWNGIVETGQIGFNSDGSVTTARGDYAECIFPLKTSNFGDYVNHYYEKKKNATTKVDRKRWKNFLNVVTGMLQRHNIFIRLAILYHAREYIKQYIDSDTVYCNVDSIVSLKPKGLPLGENIGEFKEEHINEDFKFIDSGRYQWGTECHYRSIPGCALTDIEDVENWRENLPYKLENRRLVKNEKKK